MAEDKDKTIPQDNSDPVDPSAKAPVPEAAADASPADAGDADVSAGAGSELSELMRKLDEATAESEARRQDYLRAVADLENFRKRALRERDEARVRGTEAVLEDLLPVLDNFALGLNAARQHAGGQVFAEGFAMVLTQFEGVLRQHGVEEIAPHGEPFDPNFHESTAFLPHHEIPEGHVSEVQRVGYRHRSRLLRPAQVVVSAGPDSETGDTPGHNAGSGDENVEAESSSGQS